VQIGLLLAGRYVEGKRPLPARQWLAQVADWLDEAAGDVPLESAILPTPQGPALRARIHPAADDLTLLAAGAGRVVVSARTSGAGPGYHRWLCGLLHALGEEAAIEWSPWNAAESVGDPTGYFHGGDAGAVDAAMHGWLESLAARMLARVRDGERGLPLSLRASPAFLCDGAVLTPMGPRDADWLAETALDGTRGADVFPWREDGTGPRYRLGRALSLLWSDLRWRAPLSEDERLPLLEAAELLAGAWREDRSLAYPWREWRELLGFLGRGGTVADEVRQRAAGAAIAPSIGYRRGDVRISLPGSWSIRIPGALAEELHPDGTWLARDHRRAVRFRSAEDTAAAGHPSADELLARGAGALEHRGPRVQSRATLVESPRGCELTAICAAPGTVAICTVSFEDPDDKDWALATWRSVDLSTPGSR
jgi:hypothetical protein